MTSDKIIKSTLDGNVLVIETADGVETYDSKFLVASLLIYVARGSGHIEPEETAKMLELINDHFKLQGAESLELLTRAISDDEKEEIALMALKVIAADGRREVAEMEKFNEAVAAIEISPEIVHRAFDRYFAETMPNP